MSRATRWPITWVLVAAALAVYPLLPPGIPSTADGPLHLIRSVEFDAILRSGVLYPRWAPVLAYGYGYPLFNFYAPLFYYLTEIPHLLGAGFELSLKLVIFASFAVYGLGTYWWTRPCLGAAPAAVAGVAYIFVPFRFHEAYMQGDYPQFVALALAPLALGAVYRLFTTQSLSPWHLIGVTAAFSALLLVHNISTLWLAPTLAGYALFLAFGFTVGRNGAARRCLARLAWLAGLGLLSIGLTTFFWLPALVEQNLVQLYRLRTEDYDVKHSFIDVWTLLAPPRVVDQLAANPAPYVHLGWGQVGLALLAIPLAYLVARGRRRLPASAMGDRGRSVVTHLIFGFALLLTSAALTLPISEIVWRSVPLIAYTQFPWRVLELSGIATALVAGIAVRLGLQVLAQARRRRVPAWGVVAFALAALVVPSLVYLYPREPFLTYGALTTADVTGFELNGGAVGTTSTGEYYPIDVSERPRAPLPPNLATIGRLDRATLPASGSATLNGEVGYSEQYTVSLTRPTTLRFNLIRFAGWQVLVDGRAVATRSETGDGLLLADVPAGSHQLSLEFVDTPVRRVGWLAAGASLLIGVVGCLLWWLARRRVPGPAGPIAATEATPTRPIDRRAALGLGGGLAAVAVLRVTSPAPYAAIFARRSSLDRVVEAAHPARVQLENKLVFLGYNLSHDVVVPGAQLQVTLYWRAIQTLGRDYRSLVTIASVDEKSLLTQDDQPSPGGIPTHTWPTDRYYIDDHTIAIPATALPMVYQLQIALYDSSTGSHLQRAGVDGFAGQQIVLQTIHVTRQSPVDLATFTSAGDPTFGTIITLLGFRVDNDHPKAGQTLRLTLVWRAEHQILADFTVFTHLIDANQNQTAGHDSMPLGGQYPTSRWLVGEQVVDPYDIAIPADAAAGPHHLAVGFYDPRSLERLNATAKAWTDQRSQVDLDRPIIVERP